MTANGDLFYLNLIAGVGVILNIILNLILIPKDGAFGSAVASLITQFLTAIGQIVLCFYVFRFNFFSIFSRLVIFLIGLVLFGYYLNQTISVFYLSVISKA